jgi:hypothetical protein
VASVDIRQARSDSTFYPLCCSMRPVSVFFRAHLAADSSFLCGIVLAGGGPDNFLLLARAH